jgi:ABC-type branched-subunit amino acid transport system substrate-binding protein
MRNIILKEKRLGIAILIVTLIALLLITACAPIPSAEEKQVVKIGYLAPLTGAAAAVMQPGWRNVVDYLRYFEEVGVPGLNLPPGVTIELTWGDSAFEVPRAISIYERIHGDVVFFHMPSPLEPTPLKSRLERDGIAVMCLGVDEVLMYPPGQIFSIFPTESERFAAACDWIMENWKEERPPRAGMMGTDTPAGRSVEVMGTAYAKSIGIEMLPFEVVPYLPMDVSPQLLRLAERGADFVYLQCLWGTAIPIMKDVERLGLTDKIRFGGGVEDTQSVELIEALGPVAEGYFHARAFPWYEETPILYDIIREYQGRLDTSGGAAATIISAAVPIEAIRIAIEQVGYENLDSRAVTEAMYSIKDFDPHHIARPVTYTREDNRGAPVLRIYEVQGGDVVPVTDWREAHMLVP